VVLLGHPVAEVGALDYHRLKPRLQKVVQDSLAELRARFDVVICEGAGSPAEINLRDSDITNMGLARAADLPVIVVGDIDRGGVFAAMFGTLAVLSADDQRHLAGFVINKFRGDPGLLAPGIDRLTTLTGRPTLGVLPWQPRLWLDAEDSLDLDSRPREAIPPLGRDGLHVAVARLPRMSNVTDVDALAAEPGVTVTLATRPDQLTSADLVILPGSRATVSDLDWLRRSGLADAIVTRAGAGGQVLGLCGGFQMLARTIEDDVESRRGTVDGLGLLPASVRFTEDKTLRRSSGQAFGEPVDGYEIHHGVVEVEAGEAFLDGCALGSVRGTTWHGIFDNDRFRRAFLADLARRTDRDFVGAQDVVYTRVREARYDLLADLVAEHLDTVRLEQLIEAGAPGDLPVLTSTLG
ncbi:MAG: cobyric acid synthase, partial [Actinobacteria bacterium]|nr:cobyric acid synthase [Actinomycetota bacterium]